MNIYLIRHTTPGVAKGVCYGQSDLGITESFEEEAAVIQQHLPVNITAVYSSPLLRCKILAEHLFTNVPVRLLEDLKEIDCGNWEMRLWDDIPKGEIDPWMEDRINIRIPGGESYQEVFDRVVRCFNRIKNLHENVDQQVQGDNGDRTAAIIIAHGSVIRSIMSHITNTSLIDSFSNFSFHYGCVIKIVHEQGLTRHEVLSNIPTERETHKPSR